jgi:hypothetical protein
MYEVAPTQTVYTTFITGAQPISIQIYVDLAGFPKDGTVSVQVPGTDASNTIYTGRVPIPPNTDGLTWNVVYPANFSTLLLVNYWQGATPPPPGAKIIAQAQIVHSSESISMLSESSPDRANGL